MAIHLPKPAHKNGIAKCPTGTVGLDHIADGALPQGKPTPICGKAELTCGDSTAGSERQVAAGAGE